MHASDLAQDLVVPSHGIKLPIEAWQQTRTQEHGLLQHWARLWSKACPHCTNVIDSHIKLNKKNRPRAPLRECDCAGQQVDGWGRRPLLLGGVSGMCVALLALGALQSEWASELLSAASTGQHTGRLL